VCLSEGSYRSAPSIHGDFKLLVSHIIELNDFRLGVLLFDNEATLIYGGKGSIKSKTHDGIDYRRVKDIFYAAESYVENNRCGEELHVLKALLSRLKSEPIQLT
jgi:hypothetical protein